MGGLSRMVALFGQTDTSRMVWYLLGAAALFVIPYLVSGWLARPLRIPDYRGRLGIVLFSILAGIAVVAVARYPRFGVDLRGGVILVYKVDVEATSAGQTTAGGRTEAAEKEAESQAVLTGRDLNMADMVDALKRRLNPDGLKEIVIRPFGVNQVEIIIPQAEGAEIEAIKREIATAGVLLFRIVANTKDHAEQIRLADRQLADPALRMLREVRDPTGKIVARWTPVARDVSQQDGVRPLKVDVSGDIIRDGRTGERIVDIPRDAYNTESQPVAFEKWLASKGIELVEVLMIEPQSSTLDVRGDHLGTVRMDYDENLTPCVRFTMRGDGASRMSALTSLNRPDKDPEFYRRLGIVLDNELLSAPRIMSTISDSGQITGRFTQQEVESLVRILRAGKLPAVLYKEPISENQIGPMLGQQTIRQGSIAIAVSLAAVLLFTAIYYQVAGLVACFALVLNLLLTYALLIVLSASLTLPGLAGLVLTVGMSVDANVLVFERIREELKKGAALRMAIRNGFDRALNTIVDANVTTLITGIILYVIGTDQVRGFAVTLCLGILMCMYTGVYCSRLVFEILERNRWVTRLRMFDVVGVPSFDFMSKARVCVIASLILIAVGVAAVIERNRSLLDKDIAGGVSVVMYLKEPMRDAEVRRKLDEAVRQLREKGTRVEYTLNHMTVEGRPDGTIWKVDSSFEDVDALKSLLDETFDLVTYSMTFQVEDGSPAQAPSGDQQPQQGAEDRQPSQPSASEKSSGSVPPQLPSQPAEPAKSNSSQGGFLDTSAVTYVAYVQEAANEGEQTVGAQAKDTGRPDSQDHTDRSNGVRQSAAAQPQPLGQPAAFSTGQSPPSGSSAEETRPAPAAPAATGRAHALSRAKVQFVTAIERDTLRELIEKAADELHEGVVAVTLVPLEVDPSGRQASRQWQVQLNLPPEEVHAVLKRVQDEINRTPVWIQASAIGSQVASGTRNQAIAAALASLVGIVAYIWVRFQRVAFGLAAVVALVHDVLVAIGMLALSHYIAPVTSFLLIEEFKISLPVVAALMTLIGYSLNDTIVVFDRIREVRGRNPQLTGGMVNQSVNQTLSRTLLTAGTTMLVVVILYCLGGEGIHGFAFTLLVGLIVGTYSSVFIAAPILLVMVNRQVKAAASR